MKESSNKYVPVKENDAQVKQKKSKGGIVGIIVGIVLALIAIPIIFVSMTMVVQSFTNPDKIPSFMGWKPFIVLSPSMAPEINVGDLVLASEVDPATLQKGDIVAYKLDEEVITHRITKVTQTTAGPVFTTKGDNNAAEDANLVSSTQIEGIYKFSLPGLGSVAMFLQSPAGIICLVVLPLLIFILYDIFRRRHYNKKEAEITRRMEIELSKLKGDIEEREKETGEAKDSREDQLLKEIESLKNQLKDDDIPKG